MNFIESLPTSANLFCSLTMVLFSTMSFGKEPANKKGGSQTGNDQTLAAKLSSISPDFEEEMAKAVVNFFRDPNYISEGSRLSRAESLESASIPDALLNRVINLAKIPAGEKIAQLQIADDWHNQKLSSYEPHCLGIFTDKAVYFSGTWERRNARGFYVDRIPYKDFLLTTKFNYSRRMDGENGVVIFVGGKTIESTSEVIRLLHFTSQVIQKAAADVVKNATVKANTLPEGDLRAIKGYSAVLWGASVKEVRDKFGVTLDKKAVTVDYANQRPSEVAQTWAHYQKFYPGVRLVAPLTTIQCNDNSGQLTFHFPGGRLQMVERQVSADIKKHSIEALSNMLEKYGEASRELCDFRFQGDRAIRFVWETQNGRIIALCDAWYPAHKLNDTVSIGKNELRLDLDVVGPSAKLGENDSWIAPDSEGSNDPDVKKTTGTFVQLQVKLYNKDQVQSWPFEGTVELQIVDDANMKVLTTVSPTTGSRVKYTLPADEPTSARFKSEKTYFLLFDVPLDKFAEIPSFSRLVVTPSETKEPIYSDFSINRRSIEPVQSQFGTAKPVKSSAISDLIPANMRIELVSIAYNDISLLRDIEAIDSQALRTAREDAAKREAIEKEKVKAKVTKDL